MDLNLNMLEKEILKKCKLKLDYWQSQKVCIWWDRLNSGKMQFEGRWTQLCKPGTPDLVAYIAVNAICYVIFFECKRDLKSKQSALQKEFENKFEHYLNVIYLVVTNPGQVDEAIERITKFHHNQLEQMGKDMGL